VQTRLSRALCYSFGKSSSAATIFARWRDGRRERRSESSHFARICALGLLFVAALTPASVAGAARAFRFELRDADARTLARHYADVTGRNVIVGGAPSGKVTVHWPRPLSRRDAARLLRSAFESMGLALVRRGAFVSVVPMRDAVQGPLPTYSAP
jgi:type II secretory pathway component GspD/PulD (secretin)